MSNELTAADVAAVTGNNRGNGFGWGDGGSIWLIILFLFAFMGFGNGWGGNNGGNYAAAAYPYAAGVQSGFDQAAVMGGLNSISAAVTNGFANAESANCGRQMTLMQSINGLQAGLADNRYDVTNAITNTGYNLQNQMMQNEMARQQCCCDTKQAIADVKYTIATEACADRAAVNEALRDVIDSNNRNTQAILDKMCQQEIDALKAQNANLQTQLNMAALAASQTQQTATLSNGRLLQTQYLVNTLRPTPIPAYIVPNPVTGDAGTATPAA